MITYKELNPKCVHLSKEMKENLAKLYTRINIVRKLYGRAMIVTSGVRSLEDHKRIYLEKARRLGINNIRIPMGSQHLKAAAVDIYDPKGDLYRWCKANEQVLIDAELWCEEDTSVPRVHFQIYPPKSGKRWFRP